MRTIITFCATGILALSSLNAGRFCAPFFNCFIEQRKPINTHAPKTYASTNDIKLSALENKTQSAVAIHLIRVQDGKRQLLKKKALYAVKLSNNSEALFWPVSTEDPYGPHFRALAYRIASGHETQVTLITSIKDPETQQEREGALQYMGTSWKDCPRGPQPRLILEETYERQQALPEALSLVMGTYTGTLTYIDPEIYHSCSPELKEALKKLDSTLLKRHIFEVKLEKLFKNQVDKYVESALERRDALLRAAGEAVALRG